MKQRILSLQCFRIQYFIKTVVEQIIKTKLIAVYICGMQKIWIKKTFNILINVKKIRKIVHIMIKYNIQ